jgi:hypothetical protein
MIDVSQSCDPDGITSALKGKGLTKEKYDLAPKGDSSVSFKTPEAKLLNCPQLIKHCGATKLITMADVT